jgi:hypothetical protein
MWLVRELYGFGEKEYFETDCDIVIIVNHTPTTAAFVGSGPLYRKSLQ